MWYAKLHPLVDHMLSVPRRLGETNVVDESEIENDIGGGSCNRSGVGSTGDEDNIAMQGKWDASTVFSDTAQPGASTRTMPSYSNLFGFAVSLCAQQLTEGGSNVINLVFVSCILGFSCFTMLPLPVHSYTSLLSSLIYTQHLLFLEFALPSRGYTTLDVKGRPRQN